MESVLRRVGADIAEVEEAIEHERSLLQATVETMPIGVLLVTANGHISLVNRKMLAMCGVDSLRSLDDPEPFAYFRADGTRYAAADLPIVRALRTARRSRARRCSTRSRARGGTNHPRGAGARRRRRRHRGGLGLLRRDRRPRGDAAQQQILLDEINHRVKDALATVQSIARASLSSATSLKDYAESFEQRLIALARAYNLLTENNWEGADLATIVRRTLAPFASEGRTSLGGPPVALTPKLTLSCRPPSRS